MINLSQGITIFLVIIPIHMQLPSPLIESLKAVKGFDEKAFLELHASGEQITSVRINPAKVFDKASSIFNSLLEKVKWNSNGYYLPVRPSFTADPLFHAGAYYVQDASSMFLEEAIRQTIDLAKPLRVLDLCAAPGGKSTLLQSLLPDGSLLVSNEVIRTRVSSLIENISKWGAANVIVCNNDPKDFQALPDYFDVIVADAPCSGSGLFRKDPSAIAEWSEQNVHLCSQRQQRILADVLPALKAGGLLIYSTCSYSSDENEAIADWLVSNCQLSPVSLQLKPDWNITETRSELAAAPGYRFYPNKLLGEGFFLAAFRKGSTEQMEDIPKRFRHNKIKNKIPRLTENEISICRPWLKNADHFFFFRQNDEVIVMPIELEDDLSFIQSALYIKKAGVKIGSIIRKDLIPHHELALSTLIGDQVRKIPVDMATALQYLRRSAIALENEINGWALVTYGQLPLGWVKILPGRINNYYPAAWRILNK